MSRGMRFPTMWYMRPAKAQRLDCAYVQSDQIVCLSLEYSMTLTCDMILEFLSLKGGCTGSSESICHIVRILMSRLISYISPELPN